MAKLRWRTKVVLNGVSRTNQHGVFEPRECVDEIGLNVGAIHALWTLKGLGALDGTNAEALAGAE